jgi:hypothetical protein
MVGQPELLRNGLRGNWRISTVQSAYWKLKAPSGTYSRSWATGGSDVICPWTKRVESVGNRAFCFVWPCYHQAGVPMKHMSGVVQQLKKEREHVQKQLQHIDDALAALGSISSNGASRTMSAAARRRISLAQKARWAKQRAPRPKRTISQAGRRRIAAAQRARWAKVKSAG